MKEKGKLREHMQTVIILLYWRNLYQTCVDEINWRVLYKIGYMVLSNTFLIQYVYELLRASWNVLLAN